MNILLIVSDSLRPEYLGCYGNAWIRTPNIDELAASGTLFQNCFAASFPTGPMRKDLHLGMFTFPHMSWRDEWKPRERVMAELFSHAGYSTSMVTDTPANSSYSSGFDHFEMIEGQVGLPGEVDMSRELTLPADPRKLRIPMKRLYKLAIIRQAWRGEEDRFVAQTMRATCRWLESQHGSERPFFLYADTFDPHEPWDPPRHYIDQYDPGYEGDELFEPAYEPSDYASGSEISHMRYMYAGEVSMVDRWVGHLLGTLEIMGLSEETCVILTSDHGFYHGEHGLIGKVQLDRDGRITSRWPLYRTISWIPLIVSVPGHGHRAVEEFCQPPDLLPTILSVANIEVPGHVQGISLLPALEGDLAGRRCAVTSLTYRQDAEVRCPTSYRTADGLYIYGGDEWPSEYYDLKSDPQEQHDLIDEMEDLARMAHEELVAFLGGIGCPRAELRIRKEFRPQPRSGLPLERIL